MSAFPENYDHITYPPAPWRLAGPALVAGSLVDIAVAQQFVPAEVTVLPVWPGKTLGGVLFASYRPPLATLVYHELIAFPALVSCRGRRGMWVSHIYADGDASIKGGRELWGLPKELAAFFWADEPGAPRTATQHNVTLLTANFVVPPTGYRAPLAFYALGKVDGKITVLHGKGSAVGRLTRAHLAIPPESPFAPLRLDRPFFTFAGHVDVQVNVTERFEV